MFQVIHEENIDFVVLQNAIHYILWIELCTRLPKNRVYLKEGDHRLVRSTSHDGLEFRSEGGSSKFKSCESEIHMLLADGPWVQTILEMVQEIMDGYDFDAARHGIALLHPVKFWLAPKVKTSDDRSIVTSVHCRAWIFVAKAL